MKIFIVLLLIFSMLVPSFRGDSRYHHKEKLLNSNYLDDFAVKFKEIIELFVKAKVDNNPDELTDNMKYVWDFIHPAQRFLLLNQTIFSSWDVRQKLINNETRLEWTTIPPIIQSVLNDKISSFSFIYQNFSDWGWTNGDHSNSSLFSITPRIITDNLEYFRDKYSQLTLDTIIDISKLLPVQVSDWTDWSQRVPSNYPNLFQFSQNGQAINPPPNFKLVPKPGDLKLYISIFTDTVVYLRDYNIKAIKIEYKYQNSIK